MNHHSIIAVDLMGGDHTAVSRLHALEKFHTQHPQIKLRAYVDEAFAKNQQQSIENLEAIAEVIVADQMITMDESPLLALRKKRMSSMSLSIKAVADADADAVLTAGNSGALVALAKYWLKSDAGIERPALATVLPGVPKPTLLLDIGATLEYNAEELFALAEVGAQIAPQLLACGKSPEVALLNVGTEHIKGHDTVQQADRLMQDSDINYLGFCEGTHLFKGYADVICCDGFVGNITLKACEGLMQQLQSNATKTWWQRWIEKKFWQYNGVNLNPAQYNGALLLGLDGLVVKAHGNSDEIDFYHALVQTATYIDKVKLAL
ncbi:phosphate acyltransferase [Marinicella sp. S1101]|uniref:phosphate acyltransferase n=1 Tax=Marinicella marina TaxID=2996016 RepID=UPI0022608A20|nr:phosphate acyltransferase [Marinicella marina]MCX7555036.1 phosphate acyltransferase [Marinicella marina]MDJ1141300.1 phosphate acyltransferase [Marinicella marina]